MGLNWGWNEELFAVHHLHQGKFMAAHIAWQRERIWGGLKNLGGGRGWREGSAGKLRHQGPHCPRLRQKPSQHCSYLIFISTQLFLFIPAVVFSWINLLSYLHKKDWTPNTKQNIAVWAKKSQISFYFFFFLAVGAEMGHKWFLSRLQISEHEVQLSWQAACSAAPISLGIYGTIWCFRLKLQENKAPWQGKCGLLIPKVEEEMSGRRQRCGTRGNKPHFSLLCTKPGALTATPSP